MTPSMVLVPVVGGYTRSGNMPVLLLFVAVALLVGFVPVWLKQFSLWRWRKTRGQVDLHAPSTVTTSVQSSIETDLLIQRVTPLCQQVWMAAQKEDLTAVRAQLSDQLAQRLADHPRSTIGDSPIAGLQVLSTTGDSDTIQQFEATVTTQAGGKQRWTFRRQGSGWLVDDIAA